MENLQANLTLIQQRLAAASDGKYPVPKLIAVTKTHPAEDILPLQNLGVTDIGENKVQEIMEKLPALEKNFQIHLIGRLQSNKVKYIIDHVCLIHSVDRLSLAQEIDRQAKKHGKVQDILIEVNIGGEEKKGGVAPAEVIDFAKEVDKYPSVRLKGLMSVLPNVEKDALNAFYLQLSKLYDTLKQTRLDNADIRYLSAGMSNDYDVAVKYGANIVRLGRALFGEREVITNG